MQRLHVHRWGRRGGRLGPEHVGGPVEELGLPLGDLVGMDIEVLGQLGQGLVAFTAARATLALKAGEWFRRGRLLMVSPVWQPFWPRSGRNSTYPSVQIPRAGSHQGRSIGPKGADPFSGPMLWGERVAVLSR